MIVVPLAVEAERRAGVNVGQRGIGVEIGLGGEVRTRRDARRGWGNMPRAWVGRRAVGKRGIAMTRQWNRATLARGRSDSRSGSMHSARTWIILATFAGGR